MATLACLRRRQIRGGDRVTPIFAAPDFILGVMDLHGPIVLIVDMGIPFTLIGIPFTLSEGAFSLPNTGALFYRVANRKRRLPVTRSRTNQGT
jgi:hypothetical protein